MRASPIAAALSPALALALALAACAGGDAASRRASAAPAPAPAAAPAAAKGPPAPAPAPALPPRFDPAAIDAYVAAQVARREIVGASLVIVRGGEIALARGYGVASLDTRAPVTPDTAFGIGSITKQLVCATALLLEQDGKLSLDDKVAAHFPRLTRAADITLDDLGSHLSGYPDFYPLDFVDRRMRRPITPDEILRRYATGPLEFEPRTRWSYSNTGFVLLGRILEKVSGVPLGELVRRRVFAPLGMTHASFAPAPGPGVASGYLSFALGPPRPIAPEAQDWLHAAGGAYASATDLARWDLALAGGKLLRKRSLARLATARTLADGRSTDYGCGLGVRRVGGETVLSHSGSVAGFASYNAVIPRTRSAVIFLVNTEGGSPGELHQQLLGLLIGPTTHVPTVAGPPATQVARDLFRQMQRGAVDRARIGEELAEYFDDAGLRDAAPRLRALGEPKSVELTDTRARGGMEVSSLRLVFADRVVKALLYRSPDGTVQEFLLLRD
jgi:CubicO group peptidase (beta-lactamase class C family)